MTDTSTDIVVVAPNKRNPDDVILTINGLDITGWTDVEITRGIEHLPNSFEIALTAINPTDASEIKANPGDSCKVKIGNDVVVTGYVNRKVHRYSAESHELRIIGRGKCQDLVDCSAEMPNGIIRNATTFKICQTLAEPYGIDVVLANGATEGTVVPALLINYGETAVEIIERVTRQDALLAYESAKGELVLASVGTIRAASGIKYGENVEAGETYLTDEQRFSDVACQLISINQLQDLGELQPYEIIPDPNVKRHRMLYIVAEGTGGQVLELLDKKGHWEIARRAGRGTQATVTVDSWRDSAGVLWEPNTLVPVDLPGLGGQQELCTSEVTYRRNDDTGTTCQITAMPKEAFSPEPIILVVAPVNEAQ